MEMRRKAEDLRRIAKGLRDSAFASTLAEYSRKMLDAAIDLENLAASLDPTHAMSDHGLSNARPS